MGLIASWRERRAEKRARREEERTLKRTYEASQLPGIDEIYWRGSKVRGSYALEKHFKETYLSRVGLSYEQYLRTPGWRERRRGAIERANGRCENCDCVPKTGRIEVHHLTYTT